MLHFFVVLKVSSLISQIFLARQFLMSRRQCSSNELQAPQKCQFFFVIHSFSKFASVLLILLTINELYTVLFHAKLNQHVKTTRNYFKSSYSCKIVRSSSQGFVTTSQTKSTFFVCMVKSSRQLILCRMKHLAGFTHSVGVLEHS